MKKYYYKKKIFLIASPQEQDFNLPFIEPTVHVYNDNNHYFFLSVSQGELRTRSIGVTIAMK